MLYNEVSHWSQKKLPYEAILGNILILSNPWWIFDVIPASFFGLEEREFLIDNILKEYSTLPHVFLFANCPNEPM